LRNAPDSEPVVIEAAPPRVVRVRTRLASSVVAGGVAVFGAMAWFVSSGLTADQDLAVSLGVQQLRNPILGALMVFVSYFGFQPQATVMVLAVAALFWLARQRIESLFALAAALGITMVGNGLKLVWVRPRPDASGLIEALGSAAGYSFPSGHVLLYLSFFGFLLYWAYASLNDSRSRTALLWLCGLLIALVGPSRIYLGHHWASDVLAAYALGLAYLLLLIRAYSGVRFRSKTG
jgi:membrane-associated phospholipid phosphatase